jgi:hypothetical protein
MPCCRRLAGRAAHIRSAGGAHAHTPKPRHPRARATASTCGAARLPAFGAQPHHERAAVHQVSVHELARGLGLQACVWVCVWGGAWRRVAEGKTGRRQSAGQDKEGPHEGAWGSAAARAWPSAVGWRTRARSSSSRSHLRDVRDVHKAKAAADVGDGLGDDGRVAHGRVRLKQLPQHRAVVRGRQVAHIQLALVRQLLLPGRCVCVCEGGSGGGSTHCVGVERRRAGGQAGMLPAPAGQHAKHPLLHASCSRAHTHTHTHTHTHARARTHTNIHTSHLRSRPAP